MLSFILCHNNAVFQCIFEQLNASLMSIRCAKESYRAILKSCVTV